MRPQQTALIAALISLAQGLGFTTYNDILENRDNSGQIAYNSLPSRSNTLFLYIQIIAGADHSAIVQDFKTLVTNYGRQGVSVIPRVRYVLADGSVTTEPTDQDLILRDVAQWAQIFAEASQEIDIPVIQAGFLGPWGEWHVGLSFHNSVPCVMIAKLPLGRAVLHNSREQRRHDKHQPEAPDCSNITKVWP